MADCQNGFHILPIYGYHRAGICSIGCFSSSERNLLVLLLVCLSTGTLEIAQGKMESSFEEKQETSPQVSQL